MIRGAMTLQQGQGFEAITGCRSLRLLVKKFDQSNRATGLSDRTRQSYNQAIAPYIAYQANCKGGDDLSFFTISNVKEYIVYLQSRNKYKGHPYTPEQNSKLSPISVQDHVRSLKSFSSYLYRDGHTVTNILKNLKLPKAPQKLVEPLLEEEIGRVQETFYLKSPTGFRNYVLFSTLLDTGLRASEIASIELKHVNLEKGEIKVMGKGSKERLVPVGQKVTSLIWKYITHYRPKTTAANCDNLFLSPDGRPITLNTVKLMFTRLSKRCGIKRLHAHLCRHSFSVMYLLNGGNIYVLKEILGHTRLDMVEKYLHFTSAQVASQHRKYSPMDNLKDLNSALAVNRGNHTNHSYHR